MLVELVLRFGPPVVVMGAIFAVSAQSDVDSGLGVVDAVGRKLIHMAEFALLFLLWLRALRGRAGLAALIAIGYAATDEVHQTLVSGRHGTPVDVFIDAGGVLLVWYVHQRISSRRAARGAGS
ncbi:unannotated protein [freshwater metagenome]|uniref:Unannotated protein n=1 Tax=freshwater metagenome TaxID=449393 RepID=A0A6J7J9F4_9ZZZZ